MSWQDVEAYVAERIRLIGSSGNSKIDDMMCAFLKAAAEVARLEPEPSHATVRATLWAIKRAGLVDEDIAQCLGTSRATINRWANGHNLPRGRFNTKAAHNDLAELLALTANIADDVFRKATVQRESTSLGQRGTAKPLAPEL